MNIGDLSKLISSIGPGKNPLEIYSQISKVLEALISKLPNDIQNPDSLDEYLKKLGSIEVELTEYNIGIYKRRKKKLNYKSF